MFFLRFYVLNTQGLTVDMLRVGLLWVGDNFRRSTLPAKISFPAPRPPVDVRNPELDPIFSRERPTPPAQDPTVVVSAPTFNYILKSMLVAAGFYTLSNIKDHGLFLKDSDASRVCIPGVKASST